MDYYYLDVKGSSLPEASFSMYAVEFVITHSTYCGTYPYHA